MREGGSEKVRERFERTPSFKVLHFKLVLLSTIFTALLTPMLTLTFSIRNLKNFKIKEILVFNTVIGSELTSQSNCLPGFACVSE